MPRSRASAAAPSAPVRAVLLDALGTLLELRDPAPALRRELAERFGLEVSLEQARGGLVKEIAFYRANHRDGRTHASLAALRRRSAHVLASALPGAGAIPEREMTGALLASLRFRAFPDVAPALARLRRMGMRAVVVSNWDVSLHDVLSEAGISPLLAGAITSAELGVVKPGRAIFDHALTIAGVPAANAVHVGDSELEDIAGARASGIRPILIARDGAVARRGVVTIASLRELPGLLAP